MMKTKLTTLATALLLWVVAFPETAHGQTEDIAQAYVHTVQPEMIAQFEEAVKRHVQWRKQNNDPWSGYGTKWLMVTALEGTWSGLGIIVGRTLMSVTPGTTA